jgi:hypothetical protein
VDLAAAPARGELQACERVDRDRVGIDAVDVTGDDGVASSEDGTDAIAETWEVLTADRAADGEGDLVRPGFRHTDVGPATAGYVIARSTTSPSCEHRVKRRRNHDASRASRPTSAGPKWR